MDQFEKDSRNFRIDKQIRNHELAIQKLLDEKADVFAGKDKTEWDKLRDQEKEDRYKQDILNMLHESNQEYVRREFHRLIAINYL